MSRPAQKVMMEPAPIHHHLSILEGTAMFHRTFIPYLAANEHLCV